MTLDLERLRASLLPEPLSGHFVQEDGVDEQPLTPAAVLFPIVLRDAGQTVLLTQRTAHLRDHAGLHLRHAARGARGGRRSVP